MASSPKILFVSHDASRTGAPMVLKHHLEALKKLNLDFEFDIFLKNGGILQSDFEKIALTSKSPSIKLRDMVIGRIFKREVPLHIKKLINKKYAAIFGNTVVTSDILAAFKKAKPKIITICYAHELDIAIKLFVGRENFEKSLPYIDFFLAASIAVKDNLVNNYHIPENKITVHYEHIPIVVNYFTSDNTIKEHPGLKICSSGTLDWRKGIDIFIQAAYQLNKKKPDSEFHFYWIGGQKESLFYEMAMNDINKLSIGHRVTIIENCPDPLMYMKQCDLFLLTSREDPFPLVCLEAASLGKPIICFNQSGGMTEFVDDSNGWVIDYLDVIQLTNQLDELLSDAGVIAKKGKIAIARSNDYNINVGANKLNDYINKIL